MQDYTETARKIVRRMKENLERYGWKRGSYGLANQPQCIVGALQTAVTEMLEIPVGGFILVPEYFAAKQLIAQAIDDPAVFIKPDGKVGNMARWNDEQEDITNILSVLADAEDKSQIVEVVTL